MSVDVKICGIQDEETLQAAMDGAARYVGFVFFPPSRNAVPLNIAHALAVRVPSTIIRTGMFVDADDALLRDVMAAVPLDLIQLHGYESPERVVAIKSLTKLPVMKALRLMNAAHLDAVGAYEAVADRLLLDSRIGHEPSGGPAAWGLVKQYAFHKPWMLAGGLNVGNLAEAVRVTGAAAVDVSSGVEDKNGHKSSEKIGDLLRLAHTL